MIPVPQDINGAIPADKFPTYRPWQWDGALRVVEALERGVKVVFVHAETGSGKSLLAETVRSMGYPHQSTPYLCTTISLQQQIQGDFPYAKILKGRSNYPTRHYHDMFPSLTCEDCDPDTVEIDLDDDAPDWLADDAAEHGLRALTRTSKDGTTTASRCDNCTVTALCPYVLARDDAYNAPLCVTNTSFFLREANMGRGRLSNKDLVIVDEADEFFDRITDTFAITVPQWLRHERFFPLPRTSSNYEDIQEWLTELDMYLKDRVGDHERGRAQFVAEQGVRKWRRRLSSLETLRVNVNIAANDESPWVYQGPSQHSRKGYERATLRPVWVGEWVHGFVWNHSEQWVLMSASFGNIDLAAKHLGLAPEEYATVHVDYTFPPERKPVRFWPGAKAYTKKNEREGYDAVRDAVSKIRTILDWYPNDRILIHTFSHQRTKDIAEALDNPRVIPFEGGGVVVRDERLTAFRETEGSVLISAGMERGYDFRYDECRVVILAKTPFPDFGDPVIAARTRSGYMGQSWYDLTTARSIVQMVGRGMRAEDDTVIVYILDASANKFLRGEGKKYLPQSFLNSVKFGRPLKPEFINGS